MRRPRIPVTIQGMEASTSSIRPMALCDIRPLCGLVAARFMQDPKSAFEIAGVQDPEEALRVMAAAQLGHYLDWGEAYVLADAGGVLLGHFHGEEDALHLRRMARATAQRLRRSLPPEDIDRMLQNQQRLGNVRHSAWKRRVNNGAYYEIDLLCIAASKKGTGALRRLLVPILRRAGMARIPVLVETHNPANLPIYEHFGFLLAHTYAGKPASGIRQYCLIWRPDA